MARQQRRGGQDGRNRDGGKLRFEHFDIEGSPSNANLTVRLVQGNRPAANHEVFFYGGTLEHPFVGTLPDPNNRDTHLVVRTDGTGLVCKDSLDLKNLLDQKRQTHLKAASGTALSQSVPVPSTTDVKPLRPKITRIEVRPDQPNIHCKAKTVFTVVTRDESGNPAPADFQIISDFKIKVHEKGGEVIAVNSDLINLRTNDNGIILLEISFSRVRRIMLTFLHPTSTQETKRELIYQW